VSDRISLIQKNVVVVIHTNREMVIEEWGKGRKGYGEERKERKVKKRNNELN
jgi:hypothetical protein